MMFCALGGTVASAEPIQALLIEGTVLDAGVPGFLPNRILALRGLYRLSDKELVVVHATTDPLVFSPELWSSAQYGVLRGHETLSSNGTRVFAHARRLEMQERLSSQRNWHFLFSFPAKLADADCARFATAFLDRVAFYFQSAKYQADLSFPATF